jgi:NAD(P)-dependent dehydrogenase (short-subunit alcohol dehydrogenase family)
LTSPCDGSRGVTGRRILRRRIVTTTADSSANAAKVALITGASSGIGKALALALAQDGHRVVLAARRGPPHEQGAAAVRARGGAAQGAACDVTDHLAVRRLVARAREHFGRLDVVVANAGAYLRKPATEIGRDDLEQMFAANFWSAFELVTAALPHLLAQRRGHVVLVTSFDAKKGMPQDGAYVAAKAALAGWAGCLRQALSGSGVHVCTVFPGRVDTPMVEDLEVPAISAKVAPERVARAVLRALRRRRPEVVVPWHCRLLHQADVLSPRLGDWLVRRLGLDGRAVR